MENVVGMMGSVMLSLALSETPLEIEISVLLLCKSVAMVTFQYDHSVSICYHGNEEATIEQSTAHFIEI